MVKIEINQNTSTCLHVITIVIMYISFIYIKSANRNSVLLCEILK